MKASNGRSRRVAAVSAGVLLLAVALGYRWLRRPPPDPRDVVRRLWAGPGGAKPNIMLVTLDTTRADHLGGYGYARAQKPTLDALDRPGRLMTQAPSVAHPTPPR